MLKHKPGGEHTTFPMSAPVEHALDHTASAAGFRELYEAIMFAMQHTLVMTVGGSCSQSSC